MKKIVFAALITVIAASSVMAFSVSAYLKPAFGERVPVYTAIDKNVQLGWVSNVAKTEIIGIDKINSFYKVRTSNGKEGYVESFAIDPASEREAYRMASLALYNDKANELKAINNTQIGCPLKVIDAYLTTDQNIIKKMNLEYQNIGERAISEYAIMISCYDEEGRAIKKEGGDNIFYGGSRGLSLEAEAIGKSAWTLRGFPGVKSFLFRIYQLKFADNTEWPVVVKEEQKPE